MPCHATPSSQGGPDPRVLISSAFLWLDSSWDDDDEETRRDGVCWNFNGMPHKLQLRCVWEEQGMAGIPRLGLSAVTPLLGSI